MSPFEAFFGDLDAAWKAPPERLRLQIIGSVALMLQSPYQRGTNDGDVLETTALDADIQTRLLALAGRDTQIHKRNQLYLDIVPNGIPFLPQQPTWHPAPTLAHLVHFEILLLDITDVVVSKLMRYIARDVADIDAMIDRDLVPHSLFVDRFRAAVDALSLDSRSDDLPKIVGRFHQVERDMFGVPETPIDLPSWIGNG
jgi:hypothetical protein